jgi:hypothetical protein
MRYPSHVILATEFAQQVEVVIATTLMATVQRDYVEMVNTQILQMTLAAGCRGSKWWRSSLKKWKELI